MNGIDPERRTLLVGLALLAAGADKVAVNSAALARPRPVASRAHATTETPVRTRPPWVTTS